MTHRELEDLLRHERFVRALARYLLGDRDHAEDIVQETWLAALQTRTRPNDHRSWLAGIVRNLVRRALRGRDRRARRERTAARPIHVRAADDLFMEETVRRRVAELVLALPGIYREAILLRFFDDLSPREIAERLGQRGSTVRMRIKRGLAMVRQQLVAEFDGDERSLGCILGGLAVGATSRARAAWAAGIAAAALVVAVAVLARPLASRARTAMSRGSATARARNAAPRGSAGAAGRGRSLAPGAPVRDVTGGPLDVKRAGFEVRGLVRLPAGVSTRTVRVGVFDGAAEVARTVVDGGEPFELRLARHASRVVATNPETAPGAAELRGDSFEITLTRRALADVERYAAPDPVADSAPVATSASRPAPWARDDAFPAVPAALVGIVRVPDGMTGSVTLQVSRPGGSRLGATVPPDTWFVLPVARLLADPAPALLRVDVSHPDALPLHVDAPVFVDPATGAARLRFLVLELEAARVVRGRVTLEDATPAAGATIVAFRREEGVVANAATAGEDGAFALEVGVDGKWSIAALADGFRPAEAAAPETADAPPLVLRRGATIDGHVRVAGAPVDGQNVRVSLRDSGKSALVLDAGAELVRIAGDLAWRTIALETDAKGAFRIGGLARAEYDVEVEGLAAPAQQVRAPGTADFALAPAHVVVAVTSAGAPLADALVATATAERSTNAQGEATLDVAPGARVRVTVSAPGLDAVERAATAPAAGGTTRLEVALGATSELATLEVRLDSVDGPPLPAPCEFLLLRLDTQGTALRRSVDATSGRYVLHDLEPGVYVGVAMPGGYFLPAWIDATLPRGATTPIRLPVRSGGQVRVTLQPPGGGRAPPATVWCDGPAAWGEDRLATIFGDGAEVFFAPSVWRVADGGFESGLLPAGTYTLHIEPTDPGFAPTQLAFDVRAGTTTKLTVPLVRR